MSQQVVCIIQDDPNICDLQYTYNCYMLKLIIGFLFILKGIETNFIESPPLQETQGHSHKFYPQLHRQTETNSGSRYNQHHHFLTKKTTDNKQLKQKDINSPQYMNQRQNMIEEKSFADVRQIAEHNQLIDPKILQKIKKEAPDQQIIEKRVNYIDKEHLNLQKIKSEIHTQKILKIDELKKGQMQVNDDKSQVISPQQKTLYFKLLEAIDKFLKIFSQQKEPIQYRESTNQITNSSPNNDIENYKLAQIKPIQIQVPSSIARKMQKQPSDDLLSATIQTIDSQKNNKLMKDTQILAKKRKKLYFIICTLSFGATCIFLIKMLQQKNERVKYSRQQIIKIPQEFYIQQI